MTALEDWCNKVKTIALEWQEHRRSDGDLLSCWEDSIIPTGVRLASISGAHRVKKRLTRSLGKAETYWMSHSVTLKNHYRLRCSLSVM